MRQVRTKSECQSCFALCQLLHLFRVEVIVLQPAGQKEKTNSDKDNAQRVKIWKGKLYSALSKYSTKYQHRI